MSGLYGQDLNFSPARALSPHIRPIPDDSQYLAELLAERQKIQPFVQVVPICSRLLNQEIIRVSSMLSHHGFGDFDRIHRGSPSPLSPLDKLPNLGPTGLGGWSGHPHERFCGPHGITMDWQSAPGSPSTLMVKRVFRLDIPVDSYPHFNFVGRLLGPRGNSLKRVEASTGCRVFIRGRGSIKDLDKEESLRGRPGYEHLNEPLHILIEAELPVNIIDARLKQAQEIIEELLKPVQELNAATLRQQELGIGFGPITRSLDESQDYYKKEQLRELAMIKSNSREESPRPSGSVSPFNSSGMKRAKTARC